MFMQMKEACSSGVPCGVKFKGLAHSLTPANVRIGSNICRDNGLAYFEGQRQWKFVEMRQKN